MEFEVEMHDGIKNDISITIEHKGYGNRVACLKSVDKDYLHKHIVDSRLRNSKLKYLLGMIGSDFQIMEELL